MPSNPKDFIRLQHILDAIDEIENYTFQVEFSDFQQNSMMIHASVRQLEIIGEAANHLSDELTSNYESVEWKQIIGLRNLLIHEYFGVDIAIVWNVIQFDLPHFKNEILFFIDTTWYQYNSLTDKLEKNELFNSNLFSSLRSLMFARISISFLPIEILQWDSLGFVLPACRSVMGGTCTPKF